MRSSPHPTHRRPTIFLLLAALGLAGCSNCSGPNGFPPDPEEWDPLLTDQPLVVLGTALDAESLEPIQGASAKLGELVARTDARGRFAISTRAAERARAVVVSAEGSVSAARTLAPGMAHRVDLGPVLLPGRDASATIGPAGGRVEAAAAGVTVDVPSGAFSEPVEIGISRLPLGDPLSDRRRLPADIPAPVGGHASALFAVVIDSGGVQPSEALSVTVTTSALPDGTLVPVGRFDERRAAWVDVGLATFRGEVLHFTTNHLSNFAGSLPSLPIDDTSAPSLSSLERSVSPFMPGDPRVNPRSGALQLGVPMPGLIRRNQEMEISLFYDSRTVVPKVRVPVAAMDGEQGEKLNVHVSTLMNAASLDLRIEQGATEDAAPAVVIDIDREEGPDEVATDEGPEEFDDPEVDSGTYIANLRLARPGEAIFASSASGSFTSPAAGEPLEDLSGEHIPAPDIEHRRDDQVAVAIDNRRESPFGAGWHLSGLTRLVQPWCVAERVTLVGELDWPALTFGEIADSIVRPLSEVFSEVEIDEEDLTNTKVATSGGMIYVALPARGEVWRLEPDGTAPERVAGGGLRESTPGEGFGPDLNLGEIATIAAAPLGDGILIATRRYVTHLGADGEATRVAGTGEPCDAIGVDDIKLGEPATSSTFCAYHGLSYTLAADPTSDRFVFSTLESGTFDVVDGVLTALRTREGAGPHWHVAAFDPEGVLYYGSDTGSCIYRHEDGLLDETVFPLCRDSDEDDLVDGGAEEAVVGGGRGMTFDRHGNLWFLDNRFHAIRRYRPGGEVITVSARPKGFGHHPETVSGATLGNTVPGDITTIAIHDETRIFFGGAQPGDLLTTAPVGEETLAAIGSGDGSVLTRLQRDEPELKRLEDVGYLRVLESGVIERYDERGLLQQRGKPGEPKLEYIYADDWEVERTAEICGQPLQPPRLSSIRLSGEDLWRFDYDPSDMLTRVTDAAGRTTRRTAAGYEAFELPGGTRVRFQYDDGLVTSKRAPGPNGGEDEWLFEWDEQRLIALSRPGSGRQEFTSAEEAVKVPEGRFDPLGIARDVPARIPTASAPTRSGERARVTVGKAGILLESPAGDETTLETDRFGRLLRVTMPDGGSLMLSRDEVGRLLSLVNESTGRSWSYRYARFAGVGEGEPYLDERLVERRDDRHHVTTFAYAAGGFLSRRVDPNGGVTSIENVSGGAARGLPAVVTDPEGRVHEAAYDSRGNMIRVTVRDSVDPSVTLTTEIRRDEAGRVTQITQPSGRVVMTELDVWGETTRYTVGDPAAGHTLGLERASTAVWKRGGSLVPRSPVLRAVDGEGRTWSYSWAPGWRLAESSEPATGRTMEILDDEGRILERRIADGSREEFGYDEAGRLHERTWFGPAFGAFASFVHDENERLQEIEGSLERELRSFVAGFGWTEVTRVPKGGLDQEAAFSIRRERAGHQRTQQLVGASQYRLERGFDELVERVSLFVGGGSGGLVEVLSIERDLARHVATIRRGNGTVTSIERDSLGRVVRQKEDTPFGSTVLTWTWDGDRPSSVSIDGSARHYYYDAQDRLVACTDTGESYAYDRADARATAGEASYQRDSEGRLVSDGTYSYEHDQLGRRVLRVRTDDPSDRTVYTYGAGGYLEAVLAGPAEDETPVASYLYDASGRRITRNTAEGTWHYGYLPETERLVRVLEPDDTEWHLFHALSAAAWSVAATDDGRRMYTHLDPFERVIGVSDESGELFLLQEGCFGQRLEGSAKPRLDVGFHGMPYDEESGLYYAGARYYDPEVGAFLSPDPLGLDAAPAIYDYAAGNPVMMQDPSGRLFFVAAGALLVGGVVFNEIRKVAQSTEVRQARRSYESMTDVPSDDGAVTEAEKAHQRLDRASRRGGQAAVECTVKAGQAILSPASNAYDVAEATIDFAESVMDSSDGGHYYDVSDD